MVLHFFEKRIACDSQCRTVVPTVCKIGPASPVKQLGQLFYKGCFDQLNNSYFMAQPEIHFVISAPRSGSTWLTNALNEHPDVFATEHRLFGDFCEIWNDNNGSSSPRITFDKYAKSFSVHYFFEKMGMDRQQFLDVFQRSFANFLVSFAQNRTNKRIVVDKITPYPGTSAMVVERIRTLFPESKIVQLVRDGRDVLTSGTYDWLLKDAHGTQRYAYFVEKRPIVLKRFFDDAVIEKWANNWKETIDAFKVPADANISFEAMKSDLAGQLKTVFQTVGTNDAAADNAAATAATEATQFKDVTGRSEGDSSSPTAKARKGVAGDWKLHFTRRDGQLFHDIAGDTLIKMKYETDDSWISQLPEKLEMDENNSTR